VFLRWVLVEATDSQTYIPCGYIMDAKFVGASKMTKPCLAALLTTNESPTQFDR
jgi:hypothetical protein